jgi:hypothetical protein
MLRWYVIHTKWAGETVAESNLQRQGYEVYLPRLQQTLRRRDCRSESCRFFRATSFYD